VPYMRPHATTADNDMTDLPLLGGGRTRFGARGPFPAAAAMVMSCCWWLAVG
jgi:hypothetical protein